MTLLEFMGCYALSRCIYEVGKALVELALKVDDEQKAKEKT